MFEKLLFLTLLVASCFCFSHASAEDAAERVRSEGRKLKEDGNFKEAAERFRTLALDAGQPAKAAAKDLSDGADCLLKLGNSQNVAALLRSAEDVWKNNWRVALVVVEFREVFDDSGPVGSYLSLERMRVENIRRLLAAQASLDDPADPADQWKKKDFYAQLAKTIRQGRWNHPAWRLTALTDLDVPPEIEEYHARWSLPQRAAPVDADGNPIYYRLPESWEAAENDGQRWRWALGRMAALGGDAGRDEADMLLAQFLFEQFDVQTITQDSPLGDNAALAGETGPFAVRTLRENETIARLATGLKRFVMPAEFDHIAILRRLAVAGLQRHQAGMALAQIFENRQQFSKAAACYESLLQETDDDHDRRSAETALKRITGNNGMLETGPVAPAGSRTSLSYLFRNGSKVAMTAKRLDEKKLLADIRTLIKTGSNDLYERYYMRNPEMLGRFVVEENLDRYLAETVASWDVSLSPLPDHYSSRTQIELPFDLAGCYLVEARMEDGNTSRVVLWISDLALVRKNAGQQQILYVADAAGGAGVAATVTFSGFSHTFDDRTGRNILKADEFAVKTDADGLALVAAARVQDREWLTVALTDDGRLAYLGFAQIWPMPAEWAPAGDARSFIITDRPAYRPGQDIHLKAWLAQPVYGKTAPSMAGRTVSLHVANPRGETVYDKTLTADEYGGVADTLSLGADAPLGAYQVYTVDIPGGVSFRLEEYKKPEFEVALDAPDKAIRLGDTAQLKVRAKYYYGAPVTDGTVTYKILRTPFEQSWLPPWRWDWLYGSGAWRVSYDYSWYPGWNDWGRVGPRPPWMPFRYSQPEVVSEGEGRLDADGVFRISLDTASAKELFGNQDHSYQITAEVTDKSRRTIVGSGKVVASRKPFAVSLWADRGFYTAGQEMRFDLRAMLPLGGGVETKGTATLHRIRYDADGIPTETESGSWSVATDKSGTGDLRLMADIPGQYRLVCKLTNADGNAVEGAALLTIRGDAGDGDFRFTALELVPDKQDYRVGDTVRLAVNSRNKNGVVLYLPRVERADSTNTPVTVLRLENGSRVVDIPVGSADQPNFFCEAITVFDGKIYTETREIFVPPADKTLSVEITPDKQSYAPGAKAEYKVKVTDADGKPAAGQVVVSVYDKSVEYISDGSNVGDIRSAFWNWKRYYHTEIASSLNKGMYHAEKRGDVRWEPIGVFGAQEADWNDDAVHVNGRLNMVMRSQGEFAPPMSPSLASASIMPSPAAAPIMADVSATTGPTLLRYAEASAPMMKQQAMATGGGMPAGGEAPVTVRSEFADTAFWNAALIADADGNASFSFDMPENLTAWKARAWVMGGDLRVGDGESEVETKKNVIVRPQAPRFLTQKDQVILSANLHNYLPRAKAARAELVLEGGLLEPADGAQLSRHVQLAAGGEARVDWLVNARRPGEARIVMKLFTDEESDAAEIKLPVVVHGARRVQNFGGVIRGDENEAVIRFRVPEERLPDQSRLALTFSPSIASAMLEALPFLIEYPYGCTEQTLNRFLPVVTTRHFLERTGVSLADARRMTGNAPVDAKSEEWKQTWGDPRGTKKSSPVFDDAELAAMVATGALRLSAMQNADGGWGWFSGAGERSWPHTTAVVVHGLIAAKAGDAAIPMGLIDSGANWLRAYRNEQIDRLKLPEDDKNAKGRADNLDAFIYMILAGQGKYSAEMRDFLYRDRLDLSLSALSMFGIALHQEKATNALDMVLRNLRQYEERNDELGTAWLRVSGAWWWWYNDDVETQAWYLQLLSLTDAKGETASGVAKHLLRNRKNGSYWRSTRDTAYAIEALSAYAQASGETTPDMTVDVYLDGKRVMQRRLTAAELLADNRFVLEGLAVESGDHELRLVRTGSGNVYYGGGVDLFSLEDPIAKAGFELKVDRAFYKLIREDGTADMATSSGTAVVGKVERYRREKLSGPFDEGDVGAVKVEAGDLIEVELTVEAANDYEYLVFEDMKAAGLEAVELQSGYTANKLGAYVEYRDQKVVLFVRYLPKGVYTVAYRFRAEIPGAFSALPTFGGGMYATDLFANSDEMKIRISEEDVFE